MTPDGPKTPAPVNEYADLMVIGRGQRLPPPTPPSRARRPMSPANMTPEPWPTAEESAVAASGMSHTPSPNTVAATSSVLHDVGADQSVVANYDVQSEHSGLTSMMPR